MFVAKYCRPSTWPYPTPRSPCSSQDEGGGCAVASFVALHITIRTSEARNCNSVKPVPIPSPSRRRGCYARSEFDLRRQQLATHGRERIARHDNACVTLLCRYTQSFEGERTTGSLSWVAQLQAYVLLRGGGAAASSERKRLSEAVLENPTSAEDWCAFLQHEEQQQQVARRHVHAERDSMTLSSSQLLAFCCRFICPLCRHRWQRARGRTAARRFRCVVGTLAYNSSGGPCTRTASLVDARQALRQLYHRATELVQRCKGRPTPSYIHVWLGYARHQWCVGNRRFHRQKSMEELDLPQFNFRRHSEDDARDTLKTLKVWGKQPSVWVPTEARVCGGG